MQKAAGVGGADDDSHAAARRQVEPIVHDYYEVLTLHKMLMVAKFESDIDDEYIASPCIATVQRRLAASRQAATPGSGWARWRDAAGHEHRLPRIRAYLSRSLPSIPLHARRQAVLDVLTPLEPSNEIVTELLAGLRSEHHGTQQQ